MQQNGDSLKISEHLKDSRGQNKLKRMAGKNLGTWTAGIITCRTFGSGQIPTFKLGAVPGKFGGAQRQREREILDAMNKEYDQACTYK